MSGPALVMLIRHAEKPREGHQGVDERGQPDPGSLSVTGWQRAGALVRLFAPVEESHATPRLAMPRFLIAARANEENPSTRPRDTLRPLAQALGLPIDERFAATDPQHHLLDALRGMDGPVLIAWRHEHLPTLANELLQRIEAPTQWPGERFDVVWAIERTPRGRTFAQVAQRVLAGDKAQGIAKRVKTVVTPPPGPPEAAPPEAAGGTEPGGPI